MSEKIIHVVPYGDKELKAVESDEHEFLMSSHDVAQGYGISTSALRSSKNNHKDELIEGKHFISSVQNLDAGNLQQTRTFWTKKGIVRLGFFIKSQEAKMFRDWAEDYIINGNSNVSSSDAVMQFVGMFQQSMVLQQQHNEMMMMSMNTMMEMMGQLTTMVKNVVDTQNTLVVNHCSPQQLDKIKIEVNRAAVLSAESERKPIDMCTREIYLMLNGRMGVFTYYHIRSSDYEEAIAYLKRIQKNLKAWIKHKKRIEDEPLDMSLFLGDEE